MAIRWREDGRLLCAAASEAKPGDTYIDDRLHYQLSVISCAILPCINHENSRRWYWVHDEHQFLRAIPE